MPKLSPEYLAYMKSPEWDKRRRAALARAFYRCERCGRGNRKLDCHHKTYARFMNERASDLMVLCRPCHKRVHFWKWLKKSLGKWLTAIVFGCMIVFVASDRALK
jgi:5-methylcytosine-specific restriction endonuclease McrA